MAVQTAGTTTHFIVTYDDAAGTAAQTNASALLATVEFDLFRLKTYFPYEAKLGTDPLASNPISIRLQDTNFQGQPGPQRGGGSNNGNIAAPVSPGVKPQPVQMLINAFGANTNAAAPPDYVRFVFVAELTEQLMLFYNWPQNTNQSESISRVMAELLYPTQPYDTQNCVSPAPWVNDWLAARSTDTTQYLSTSVPGENNSIAWGCGILFLNYMRFQLNLSLPDICQAAGPTLADRYHQVSGLTNDPLAAMNALLDKHFLANAKLANNNPFPLLDAANRQVFLQFAAPSTHTTRGLSGVAHLRPFFNCPAKDYQFLWMRSEVTQKVTASTFGFGDPQFQWKIGAYSAWVASSSGSAATDVAVPDPKDPNAPVHEAADFMFNFSHAETGTLTEATSALQVTNTSFQGDYTVDISVSVTERVDDDKNAVVAHQKVDFNTLWVLYDQQYQDDQTACAKRFEQALDNVPKLEQLINLIKTLPDPPSDRTLEQAIAAALEIERQIAEIADSDKAMASKVARYVAWRLGISAGIFQQQGSGPEIH
jgi:hypothetical protein